MNITVSILCYNYGRYLNQAIDSALSQEIEHDDNLEVIVIDDGSTDETPQICAEYGKKIKTFRSQNQGFAASLTKSILNASGEYVLLLDADDYFAPNKLKNIRQHIKNNKLYIDHDQWFVNETGDILPGIHHGGNTSTICIHRASALPLLPIENEVALQTLWRAGQGVRLSEPLGYYRQHQASMTNRKQPGAQNDYLAGVHHRLAAQLNSLATLPVWLTDWRALRAIVQEYAAMGYYCELEAALERRQPVVAYKACARMVIAARRSRLGLTLFTAKMIVKTLLMRPSFPKVGHP